MRINYGLGSITPEEVVRYVALSAEAGTVWNGIILEKEAVKKARELGIEVSDEELQSYADNYRKARGLELSADTLSFLEAVGMTPEAFELYCESFILIRKLTNHFATDERIEEHFANNRQNYDSARISIITVDKEDFANELNMQIVEDGESFHELARKHSLDEATKFSGGYLGYIARGSLNADISAKVFNASAGEVVGPFGSSESFQLLLVEEVIQANLENDSVKEAVRNGIMLEWLSQSVQGDVTINP